MFKYKAALRLTRSAQTSPARRLTTSLCPEDFQRIPPKSHLPAVSCSISCTFHHSYIPYFRVSGPNCSPTCGEKPLALAALGKLEHRMLQLFYVTVRGRASKDWASDEVLDNPYALSNSPRYWKNFWNYCATNISRLTSSTNQSTWVSTVLWISISPIPATSCLWQWTLQNLQPCARV